MPQPVTYRGMSLIVPDNDSEWKEYYAHARQHRLHGTTVLAGVLRTLDGHLGVLQSQICAFLRTLARSLM